MPNAGQIIRALDFAGYASDTENTSGTTGSTSYTATLTGGTACEVTFVAPTSGRVMVTNTASLDNSAGISAVSFRVGTGSTPGAGTAVVNASDLRALRMEGTNLSAGSFSFPVTGLTAGSTYNIQQQYAVSSGTGTFSNKSLLVVPIP